MQRQLIGIDNRHAEFVISNNRLCTSINVCCVAECEHLIGTVAILMPITSATSKLKVAG